jgi:hypothetical protein
MQEQTLRSVSPELHYDFGQVLTAIGALLHRAEANVAELPTASAMACGSSTALCSPH